MDAYQEEFARCLAETGAIFFQNGLVLKDGRPTPYFINMAVFRTGRLALEMGRFFAGMMVARGIVSHTDVILGPSYKGSAIALATAIALFKDYGLDLAFEYDRKEAKTHGEGSGSQTLFVNGSLADGSRIFIVDDVATSMGTKFDLLKKIEGEARRRGHSYRVVGIGIGLDREQTTAVYDDNGEVVLGRKGENAVERFTSQSGVPVFSVVGIREVVDYLYGKGAPVLIAGLRRPIDKETKAQFDAYLDLYGVP